MGSRVVDVNGVERYVKDLPRPLAAEQAAGLERLGQFHVVEGGAVYRSVAYNEVRPYSLSMEVVRGHSVKEILGQSDGRFSVRFHREAAGRTAELAGRWLAHFHRWPTEGPCEPYDVPVRAEGCKTNLAYLESCGLPTAEDGEVRRLLARVQAESVRDMVVTMHGDFKPGNLMVSGTEIIGIDMEGCHRGHPLVDVGRFLAHIPLSRSSSLLSTGRAAWWSHLVRRFLVGYLAVADWDLDGLGFRQVDATLAVLVSLAARHPGPFWRLRGKGLMVRSVRHVLKVTSKGAIDR